MLYVANRHSDTVSVINGTTNKPVQPPIPTGRLPYQLHIDPDSEIIYVVNLGSNTISEINSTSNKVLVGETFNVVPADGGYIQCNGDYVSGFYVRYEIGTDFKCVATPTGNHRFSSWSGNLVSNLDSNNPTATFKATHYGELNGHFQVPVNITIPQDYFTSISLLNPDLILLLL